MPPGLTAKLHSFVASNSAACLSFIIARAISAVCWGVSGWFATGEILPSILIAGGKPAVMKRSEALFATMARSKSCMNFSAWSLSTSCPRIEASLKAYLKASLLTARARASSDAI